MFTQSRTPGQRAAFGSTARIIIPLLPRLWPANCGFGNYPIETQSCYTSILNTKSYSMAIFPRNIFIAGSSFCLGSRRIRKDCPTEMLLKWRWDRNTRLLPLRWVQMWTWFLSRAPGFGPLTVTWGLLGMSSGVASVWHECFKHLCPKPRTSVACRSLNSCSESLSKTSTEHKLGASSMHEGCLLRNQSMTSELTYLDGQAVFIVPTCMSTLPMQALSSKQREKRHNKC